MTWTPLAAVEGRVRYGLALLRRRRERIAGERQALAMLRINAERTGRVHPTTRWPRRSS